MTEVTVLGCQPLSSGQMSKERRAASTLSDLVSAPRIEEQDKRAPTRHPARFIHKLRGSGITARIFYFCEMNGKAGCRVQSEGSRQNSSAQEETPLLARLKPNGVV